MNLILSDSDYIFFFCFVVLESWRGNLWKKNTLASYSRFIDAKSFLNRFDTIDVIRYWKIEVRFVVGPLGPTRTERGDQKTSKCGPGKKWPMGGDLPEGARCRLFFLNFLAGLLRAHACEDNPEYGMACPVWNLKYSDLKICCIDLRYFERYCIPKNGNKSRYLESTT